MKSVFKTILAGLILGGMTLSTQAADYYVAQSGQTPVSPYSNPANAASNIQEAVAQAAAGDTVWVGPGLYRKPPVPYYQSGATNVVGVTVPLTLRSSSGNPANTIIDGQGIYRCVWMGALAAQTLPYALDGFTITNGYAASGCGGVYIYNSGANTPAANVRNCVVADNRTTDAAGNKAGGLFVSHIVSYKQDFQLTVSNCVVRGCSTNGLYVTSYSSNGWTTIANCLFENNVGSAAVVGGGTFTNHAIVKDCVFRGNRMLYGSQGAGLYSTRRTLFLRNCLFYNNKNLRTYAVQDNYGGAAMYLGGAGSTNYIENCTVVSNYCTSGGKAVSQHFNVQVARLRNTLIYFNKDVVYGDTVNADHGLSGVQISTFTNCLVRGTPTGSGNLTKFPEFIDLNGGNVRLRTWSSGVDAGLVQPWMSSATDLEGNPRVSANGLVDIGCYETAREPRPIHYVARSGQTPMAPYTNLMFAASNIQDAINAAVTSDVEIVQIQSGRYTLPPNFTNYGGSNVFYINKPITVRGDTENPRNVKIDGQAQYRGGAVKYSGRGRIQISGLTFTNCHGTTAGGGLLIHDPLLTYSNPGSTVMVDRCVFQNNKVTYGPAVGYYSTNALGGGLSMHARSRITFDISNCLFRANLATNERVFAPYASLGGEGGGIHVNSYDWPVRIRDCQFRTNVAYRGANAMVPTTSMLIVERCVIADGKQRPVGGQSFGGGFFTVCAGQVFRDCLMYGNDAIGGRGGAINCESRGSNGVFELRNCTLANNTVGIYSRGWGPAQFYFPSLHLYNTIVYSNGINFSLPATPANYTNTAVYSCYTPTNPANLKWSSSTHISAQPRFKNASARNCRLQPNSPCVDAGLNQAGMDTQKDLDNHPRLDIQTGVVDMGCYEFFYTGSAIIIR